MKESIGTKDPIVFFDMLTDLYAILFEKIEKLEADNHKIKMLSALATKWDPRVASDLLAKEITMLRLQKDVYFDEITKLKQAYADNKVTQSYEEFCSFWQETLGWHPFMEA